jgi:hypothetical protein
MIPSELFDRNVSSELRRLQLCRVMDNSKAEIWRIGVDAVSDSERDFFATNNEISINQIGERPSFQSKGVPNPLSNNFLRHFLHCDAAEGARVRRRSKFGRRVDC